MSIRDAQRPIKASYRKEPGLAKITLVAKAEEAPEGAMSCSIDIGRAIYQAQAHAGVGGQGTSACSGDLLLGALAACSQITIQMVADSMGIELESVNVEVTGELDLRGTLGIDRSVPVGFQNITTSVSIRGDLSSKQMETLKELSERCCVVLSTLRNPPVTELLWKHEE